MHKDIYNYAASYIRNYFSIFIVYLYFIIFLISTEKQNELDSLSNLADPSAILAAFTWDVDSIRALENAYRTDYNPNCGSIPNTDVRLSNLLCM